MQSDGGYLFPRERDHCNKKAGYYFPENERFRWWQIISQRTGSFKTYGVLQSEGGLLFPRQRDHGNELGLSFPREREHCIQMVANYFSEDWNFSNIGALQSDSSLSFHREREHCNGLLFPRERALCNQMVANYFPENETSAIRRWLIISQRTRPLHSDDG